MWGVRLIEDIQENECNLMFERWFPCTKYQVCSGDVCEKFAQITMKGIGLLDNNALYFKIAIWKWKFRATKHTWKVWFCFKDKELEVEHEYWLIPVSMVISVYKISGLYVLVISIWALITCKLNHINGRQMAHSVKYLDKIICMYLFGCETF